MGAIPDKNYKKIKDLYDQGFSAKEIAFKYSVSIDAVFYFLRKHNIPRRNPAERNFVKFNKKKASFKLKRKLSEKNKILKMAGIMLYWGEGSQWAGEKIVDFTNSNPDMINGLIHIRYYDKKLLDLIRVWIENYIKNGSVA